MATIASILLAVAYLALVVVISRDAARRSRPPRRTVRLEGPFLRRRWRRR